MKKKTSPSSKSVKKVVKKVKQVVKKPQKSVGKAPKKSKASQSQKDIEHKSARLLAKGKERGFVTYDEILKEFPTIEEDIIFLDELYEKLATSSIDILEGGGLLDFDVNEKNDKKALTVRESDSQDSIQMYLKEIGQYPLISAAEERELAKRIEVGDREAVTLLARANLRLVVSIAKNM